MQRLPRRHILLAGTLVLVVLAFAVATSAKKPPKPPPEPPDPPDPAIAYVDTGAGDIMVMNDDGSSETVVLESVPFLSKVGWSPDATQLLFSSELDGPGLYRVDIDGSNTVKLASTYNLPVSIPAWSPVSCADGNDWIAFDDEIPGSGYDDIYLVRPDGTGRVQLTDTVGVQEWDFAWNPLATRLAVIRTRWVNGEPENRLDILDLGLDTGGQLYVTGETCLTCDPTHTLNNAVMWEVDWARTQDLLAITAAPVGATSTKMDVWLLDLLDPGNPVQVTQTPDNGERYLTWAPDDTEIAYKRGGGHRKTIGIYAIRPDGTGLRFVKKGLQLNYPDWRR